MPQDDEGRRAAAVPAHVAVIPDGSRRWAWERGLAVAEGYREGARTALQVVAWCLESGVAHLSAFGSSQENLARRTPEEIVVIHAAVSWFCAELAGVRDVALHVFGAPERLPPSVPDRLELVRLADADVPTARVVVHVGVGYSGREEMVAAVEAAARDGRDAAARGPERLLRSGGIPPVDLLLRTGGQQRLSGFLPLQTAYAELCFIPALWPALTRAAFRDALDWYAAQERHLGR